MKKRSVLYTWAIELALMLLLTVAMCTALTGAARSRLLSEYEQFTSLQQEKIETALDSYFNQLRVQAVELLTDSDVSEFAYLTAPATADNYTLYLVQNRLLNVVSAGIAEHVYVFYQNIQRAISDVTILEMEDCATQLLGGNRAEHMHLFLQITNQTSLNRLIVTGSGENTVVLTATSIPSVGRWPRATILQQVSIDRLQEILDSQSSLEQATTLLLNEENQVVCHMGDSQLAAQLASHYDVRGAANRFESEGREYWLYQKQLSSTGWMLITAAPMEIIESRSDWVWQLTIVFLAALVLLWIAASITIIHWNYRPLKKLKTRAEIADDYPGNEYDQIGHALQTAQKDLHDLKLMQHKHREELRREWLGNAIAYDIPLYREMSEELLAAKMVDVVDGYWQLVLLHQSEQQEAMEVLPDQSEQGCHAILTSVRGRQVLCLIGVDHAKLSGFARTVLHTLHQNGVDYVNGTIHHGFAGLHDEFLSLCERADRTAYDVKGAVGAFRLSLSSSEEIVQRVFSGKGNEACALLARSAQTNLSGRTVSVHLIRMYYNDFLLQLLNHVPEGAICAEVQRAIISTARALSGVVTQQDMQELIDTLLKAIADKYQPLPDEVQPELLDRCIVCVREHFREHDFNVSRMADMLGVSVPYLSKYFKEHAGVNLLGYLNSVRIDYAKKLIAEEKLTVAAAADRAGFENINTFIRLFKKYVGNTPGSYSKQ